MSGTDPVSPLFVAGSGPVPGTFDGQVQAPFAFLTSKVAFRAQLQGGQSLGAGFNHLIYDTILEDPYSGWNAGTGLWTCPAGCSGWYDVSLTGFTGNLGSANAFVQLSLYLNGTVYQQASEVWAVDGHQTGACAQVPVALTGGQDYIAGYLYTSVSSSTPTTAGELCTIEVAWISL